MEINKCGKPEKTAPLPVVPAQEETPLTEHSYNEPTDIEQSHPVLSHVKLSPAELSLEDLTAPLETETENIAAEVSDTEKIGEKILMMFTGNKITLAAAIVLALLALVAIFAGFVAPHPPNEMFKGESLKQPSLLFPLGTDQYGRCVLSRIIYGSRISLVVGFLPTIVSMTIGVILGLTSGFFGGKVDFIIMRFTDMVMSLPSLLLTLLIVFVFDPSIMLLFVAMSIASWPGTARIVRSQALAFKEKEFVEAARAVGVSRLMIMLKHIFPNCLPTLVVLFTMSVPNNIMVESGLAFLGLGIPPPTASWGSLINNLRSRIDIIPVSALAPGLFILLTVMAFNFLGDGLRDAIDPYMKE